MASSWSLMSKCCLMVLLLEHGVVSPSTAPLEFLHVGTQNKDLISLCQSWAGADTSWLWSLPVPGCQGLA